MEISLDAGSIPAASTDAGVTTRLKPKQARQLILASLSFWSHASRVLALWRMLGCDRRGTHLTRNRHQKGSNGPKGSKSRDTPPSRPATEVSQKQGRNELTQIAVLHHNTNRHRRENPRPCKCEFITPRSQVRKLFPQLHPRQRNDARRPIESENEYRLLATLLVFMD